MTSGGIKMGMTPPHPGVFIWIEALEELGLSVSAAARILSVRRATLSDLLNGNASLSPEMALRVEKAFGLSMDLLLRMQAWHDATQMRAPTRSTFGGISPHDRRHRRLGEAGSELYGNLGGADLRPGPEFQQLDRVHSCGTLGVQGVRSHHYQSAERRPRAASV